jgi:hypothetical protein
VSAHTRTLLDGVLYGFWCDGCRVSAYVVQMS